MGAADLVAPLISAPAKAAAVGQAIVFCGLSAEILFGGLTGAKKRSPVPPAIMGALMKICYLDAFSGISGDMTVGALIDAGVPADQVLDSLRGLNVEADFKVEKTWRRGVAASKFRVEAKEVKAHRHLHHILNLLEKSFLSDRAKQNASAVFCRLGWAEARIHGVPI